MTVRQMRPVRLALALGLAGLVAGCHPENRAPPDPATVHVERGHPQPAANETAALDGTLTYRQRMALPKDALVVVRLVELSGGSSARAVASEHGFLAQGQVPIDFRLPYDPSLVSPEYSYGIEAYIFVDGALWFMTAQPVAVLTQGAPDNAQVLLEVATQPS